jgi:D-sorbitol dehydrogenase (acceptor)
VAVHQGGRLQDRVAIVTGGASGIGKGIVERLVADGACVCIADIALDPAQQLASRFGERAIAVQVDMTREVDVDGMVSAVVDRFGGLDIMVNNAGTIAISPLVETKLSDWQRLFAVNVDGVFLGSRAAAKQMIAQGRGGSIINASSGAGKQGGRFVSHYCATKAAVILMTQSLALELAPHRIRANCYAPGHIDTPMWGDIAERIGALSGKSAADVLQEVAGSVPWGRFGTPQDVAAVVSFLASDDADYVNGQTVSMNGAELLS